MSSAVIIALNDLENVNKYLAEITDQIDYAYLMSLLTRIEHIGENILSKTIDPYYSYLQNAIILIGKLSDTLKKSKAGSEDYVLIKSKIFKKKNYPGNAHENIRN